MDHPTPTDEPRELIREGSQLRYWLDGDPQAPLVALTHGVSLDHRAFAAQAPALASAGYRVLTWDVRGHGASQPMGSRMTISGVADDLVAVLDAVGADGAVMAGQSFGGMVIQDLLARHPERVAALAVVGAPWLGDRPAALMRVFQRLRIPLAKAWPDAHLRKTFATMIARDPDVRRYVLEANVQMSKPDFVAVSKAAVEGYLREGDVPTHGVPLLLIHGEREESLVRRSMAAWAARDPVARHEVVAGAGHLVNQERPEAFNEVLLGFLAERGI